MDRTVGLFAASAILIVLLAVVSSFYILSYGHRHTVMNKLESVEQQLEVMNDRLQHITDEIEDIRTTQLDQAW